MQEIPQRLIVVGGVVAREAATWMSVLGSDVTMLVRGSRLLSAAESFASRLIEKALAARGITVITDAQVVAAERPQASDRARSHPRRPRHGHLRRSNHRG